MPKYLTAFTNLEQIELTQLLKQYNSAFPFPATQLRQQLLHDYADLATGELVDKLRTKYSKSKKNKEQYRQLYVAIGFNHISK